MKIAKRSFAPSMLVCGLCVVTALAIIGFTSSKSRAEQAKFEQAKVDQAKAEQPAADQFKGPSFRKGLWHFVRTLDLVAHRKSRQRLLQRELTACVDPTVSMKATFASPSVGNCVSAKPEKNGNMYFFANRCDYMGPVSTTITVDNDDSYTEQNEISQGAVPRVELVVAKRIGDCGDGAQPPAGSSALTH